MRAILISTLMIAALSLGACNEAGEVEQPRPAAELTPEELGRLGAELEQSPDRADEILAQHGLDEETFEQSVRKVTEDFDSAQRYADAYNDRATGSSGG